MDEVEELDLVLDHYAITWAQMWPQKEIAGQDPVPWQSWDLRRDVQNKFEYVCLHPFPAGFDACSHSRGN